MNEFEAIVRHCAANSEYSSQTQGSDTYVDIKVSHTVRSQYLNDQAVGRLDDVAMMT